MAQISHRLLLTVLLTSLVTIACLGGLYRIRFAAPVAGGNRTAVIYRTPCNGSAILCGLDAPQALLLQTLDININALKLQFHQLMVTVKDSLCLQNFARFGVASDGGYDVCMRQPFAPRPGDCLVYSFGVAGDWSFDESVAQYGCEVHSFDPSIGKEDHVHSPNVHFHNLGLSGDDYDDDKRKWKLRKLSTIRAKLGHTQRTLDVLKVDVESAEWPFLRNIVDWEPEQIQHIRQLLLEVHTPRFDADPLTTPDLVEMIYYLRRLTGHGMVPVRNRQVNWCCATFSPLMPRGVTEKCCHETFYVNRRFLPRD